MELDKKIVDFITDHHVLTLATYANDEVYCSNMFYAYLQEENCFVFTSDTDTRHMRDIMQHFYVAGSIVLETHAIGKLQGLQFQGIVSEAAGDMKAKARKAYLSRFPYAIAMLTTPLWILDLTFAKLTDNRLGFGKKITWQKDTSPWSKL